ncbi:MAG: fructose-bisphosphate aldolase [Verrucomicrobiaceae bacterium]|nr:fructose-bisphosphate aldolase [Verrucomicrobiaceae bacterium]
MAAELQSTIQALLSSGKGILAADESFPTIEKRFTPLGIASTPENRQAYRDMLFATPGLGDFISGVILFDETLHQTSSSGLPFPQVLAAQGIIPGIKVDGGTTALVNFAEEKMTLGLDGLRERLNQYREAGARFTKWRAAISIGSQLPTATCLRTNAQALALFAALSQEAGLVPIVEPEVLMDGDHTIERCEEVTQAVLQRVFEALAEYRVSLEGMLLKSGMVLAGRACAQQAGLEEMAASTVRCFRRTVPAAVPGIVFLSGGQDEAGSTQRLNAIASLGSQPWRLTFSFGRALQDAAMAAWKGEAANAAAAQKVLLHRARCNSLAALGRYEPSAEPLA